MLLREFPGADAMHGLEELIGKWGGGWLTPTAARFFSLGAWKMYLLKADGLAKQFGDRVLFSNATFMLMNGESISIRGESGAGKTTLTKILLGFENPDQGSVILGSPDSWKESLPEKSSSVSGITMSSVYQHGEILPQLSALENVMLPLLYQKVGVKESKRRSSNLLEDLRVSSPDTRGSELSGGERQRVAIARALVTQPDLVIADEPTGSLDALNREIVGELLFSLTKGRNAGLIVVTHDDRLARRADKHLVLTQDGLKESQLAHA